MNLLITNNLTPSNPAYRIANETKRLKKMEEIEKESCIQTKDCRRPEQEV